MLAIRYSSRSAFFSSKRRLRLALLTRKCSISSSKPNLPNIWSLIRPRTTKATIIILSGWSRSRWLRTLQQIPRAHKQELKLKAQARQLAIWLQWWSPNASAIRRWLIMRLMLQMLQTRSSKMPLHSWHACRIKTLSMKLYQHSLRGQISHNPSHSNRPKAFREFWASTLYPNKPSAPDKWPRETMEILLFKAIEKVSKNAILDWHNYRKLCYMGESVC